MLLLFLQILNTLRVTWLIEVFLNHQAITSAKTQLLYSIHFGHDGSYHGMECFWVAGISSGLSPITSSGGHALLHKIILLLRGKWRTSGMYMSPSGRRYGHGTS